jgi:hypothetical protein
MEQPWGRIYIVDFFGGVRFDGLMARPLRIDLAGAWYHVINRGHRGGALFCDGADRRRFLDLVAELPDRFGLEVHAFVLMDNHYHLLLRMGEANLKAYTEAPIRQGSLASPWEGLIGGVGKDMAQPWPRIPSAASWFRK